MALPNSRAIAAHGWLLDCGALHSFDVEHVREGLLLVRHHALLLEAAIQAYITAKKGQAQLSRSLGSFEESIEGFLGEVSMHQMACHFTLLLT